MDYKKMYHTLFNAITDTIENLSAAQKQTEDVFIEGDEPQITIAPEDGNDK